MKIIIAGVGKVGETLAAQLSAEDYDVTLIDTRIWAHRHLLPI